MDEKLINFFKLINYNDVLAFENAKFKEMAIRDNGTTWIIRINAKELIPVKSMMNLITLCKDGINDVKSIIIEMNYEILPSQLILEYFLYFLDEVINNYPSLSGINKDSIDIDDDIILIEVTSKSEEATLKKEVKKILNRMDTLGIHGIDASFKINEEEKKNIKEKIEAAKENVVIPTKVVIEDKPKWTPKKKVEYQREGIVSIASIEKEENAVNLEAYIFSADFSVLKKKDGNPLYLVTLKISDNTSSILAKTFASDEEEFNKYGKELKSGKWYHFIGQVRDDSFAHDLVFQFRSYEEIDDPTIKRKDEEIEKRCELHAHTMMSQMDGVCDEVALVKRAMEYGHKGIAITDHDCCQSFPHVFDTVTKFNKGRKKDLDAKIKENEETLENIKSSGNQEGIEELEKYIESLKEEKKNFVPFKAGYGVELEMTESKLNVVFNPNDELIEDNTFVIFDTETTGFNPGLSDSMIEIGAVKLKNGEVVDRFDELINPGRHIDESITRVTNISDDDVKDADNEENVIKRFKEWIGSLPLVAHNARFDKNMLDMAYYKYNLGKLENPIIDTLMLSRVINRELKKHSLKALGKFYGIDTGEAEDEEQSDTALPSGSFKFDDEDGEKIEDVLVDSESILKVQSEEYLDNDITTESKVTKVRNTYYLPTIYKKSKTEKCEIEVKFKDGSVIKRDFTLHPAENACVINYASTFGEKEIPVTIYVGQHHGADVDSENTGYIFNKMLKQIEGLTKISELNDLYKLEDVAFRNDHKKLGNIAELCSYKNYVIPAEEDKTYEDKDYPFLKYDNKNYVWKFPWCKDDFLQMYENIPGKTFTENLANIYDFTKHVTFIAKNKVGLKNMFKLISFANTNFIERNAKIPRKLINEYREGILVGSACLNGEIFNLALTRCEEDLIEAMKFYDYIEIQPIDNYKHLLKNHDISNMDDLKLAIRKIIKCAKSIGKMIVATSDVHNIDPQDLISREIIVNQNVPGKGRHPLARYLKGDYKVNVNKENIEHAIKQAHDKGHDLTSVDIKVLKYIYALTNVKNVEITSNNLALVYAIDKNNQDEAAAKTSFEEKKYMIDSSLRKLQIAGLVSVNYVNGTYSLLCKYTKSEIPKMGHIPNQFFRTTREMLDEFAWLNDRDLIHEIVIENPNKIIDMLEEIEVVVYPDKPYSPIIEHSQETCRDLVFDKAHSMYGDPLPANIEERIAQEFYGDKINVLVQEKIDIEHPEMSEEEKKAIFTPTLHDVIMSGYDGVVNLKKEQVKRLSDKELTDEEAIEEAKAQLTGIIGGGFDVIYLIAQKLVKHSNDDGYLVGSRGSVGSSFVASMMGITECNGLPAHYYCPNCQYSEFNDKEGRPYSENYPSGFDLPETNCPKCGTQMIHQGNDMPFATFLGFAGEKVPDIDLNFSGDNQASAHEYTKVLFGTDNVYRAGTIGTVADKTAFGYVQGYYEDEMYNELSIECACFGLSVTSKDELRKKGLVKSFIRIPEIERMAVGCTGVKRTTGQHPGGIVVVPGYKDIWDFTPFQYPADDPTVAWRTTHFDYHAIDADLLKLDILGHDDPTVLKMLQDLSGIDVTKIDLGDRDTMKIFTGPEVLGVEKTRLRGLTSKDGVKYCPTGTLGVPEFGTSFLLGMLEETKPTTFAELIKISGLSHGTDVWLGNARDLCTPDENGNIQVPFKNVIGCRDDIMVNLIQWGVPAGKAFKIMEFVRKGKPSKDPATWAEHAAFLREYNIPEWYIESCRKIKYMFPKAHATAYVTSAFRIAWFKVHHPIWYYCAYLSIRRDAFDIASMIRGENAIREKIDEIDAKGNLASNKEIDTRDTLCICLEAAARGIYFKNIDIEKSDAKKFVITDDGNGLIIPFCALDGLGENVAKEIIKAREDAPFISQEDLQKRGKVNGSSIEKLKALGCLDGLSESNQLSLF